MVKYVLKRIALMFFVFFTILTVCFVLVKLLPLVDAKQFGKDMNLIQQRREALADSDTVSDFLKTKRIRWRLGNQ